MKVINCCGGGDRVEAGSIYVYMYVNITCRGSARHGKPHTSRQKRQEPQNELVDQHAMVTRHREKQKGWEGLQVREGTCEWINSLVRLTYWVTQLVVK